MEYLKLFGVAGWLIATFIGGFIVGMMPIVIWIYLGQISRRLRHIREILEHQNEIKRMGR